jgi:peptidoglycan L-alanyl-D-glutamate endopeptidase CwlK
MGGCASTWDPVTDRRIGELDPRIQQPARDFIEAAGLNGIHLRISVGYRDFNGQWKAFYLDKTSSQGPGWSYHNFYPSLAFDVAPLNNGRLDYNVDWAKVAALGKAVGFGWGGDWSDRPHFQMPLGESIKKIKAAYGCNTPRLARH